MMRSAYFFLCFTLAGCTLPSMQKVQNSFSKQNPNATVIAITGGLTNHLAEFHIYYREPGTLKDHETVWHYSHHPEAWTLDKKETVR